MSLSCGAHKSGSDVLDIELYHLSHFVRIYYLGAFLDANLAWIIWHANPTNREFTALR